MTPEWRAEEVKRRARALGFDSVGITDLRPPPHADALRRWLEAGMAGSMRYMHRQAGQRLEPQHIVRGATRAVVVTRKYYHHDPPGIRVGSGRVAMYAWGQDYHRALQPALRALAEYLRELGGPSTVTHWYVDHGPVPERELAQRAGLGWIGKNTMLIDPRRGSYFFIATVLTDLDLGLDEPFDPDRCGTCTRCLDSCPTNAFPAERVLDSRLCISYLTIEHRGTIDFSLHGDMGDWIFGCDVCQEVCPWNHKFAAEGADNALPQEPALAMLDLRELLDITPEEFDRLYGGTPLERPGVAGMKRNARIALRNAQQEATWPTSPIP